MHLKLILLFLLVQTIIGLPLEDKPFDFSHHKLIRILPKQLTDLERLEEFRTHFDSKVDFWNHPMKDMRPVLSLVDPEAIDFLNALNSSKIRYEIVANNFQQRIDDERQQNERNKLISRQKGSRAFDYDKVYHTYDEIIAEMKAMPERSKNAKYLNVGTTYQKREIPGIVITKPGSTNKKSIILECGIHSREWITTAACLWIANQLLTNSALDSYLDKYEFVIVPTLNTDGYVYTWTSNRNWRKTRVPYYSGMCYGADPNRNWDAAHCASGASTNPCSDTYCGPSPFSEPCAKAMADLVRSRKGNIAAYFAVHSYSQLWMYPYGYSSSKKPSNIKQLADLSSAALNAISKTNGLKFTAGTIAETIYVASGSSIDWAYDSEGVTVAFALELRDTGKYGFQLPPDQIYDGSTETWAGIKAVIDKL